MLFGFIMYCEKESFNMMYIVIILLSSISTGISFPQRNHGYEGNFGYDPHQDNVQFPGHVKRYEPKIDIKPTPAGRYDTYVPLIDGRPIYIPEINEDLNIGDELHHNSPKRMKSKHSWGPVYENPEHRISHMNKYGHDARYHFKGTHQQRRERDNPKGYFGSRHAKPAVHQRPVVNTNFHHQISRVKPVSYIIPEDGYHTPVLETLSHKEKHVTHVKPVDSEEILLEYDGYEAPVVVEALVKNEKPVTHVKPTTHISPVYPDDIVVPESYEYETSIEEEAFSKKHGKPVAHVEHEKHVKPIYPEEIIVPEYDGYEAPVVVEALTKKEKPVYSEEIFPEYEDYDTPIVAEALIKKEKPVTHVKPITQIGPVYPDEIVVPESDEYKTSVEVEAFSKKEKPVTYVKPEKHEKPVTYVKPEKHEKPVTHVKPEKHEKPVTHVKPEKHDKPVTHVKHEKPVTHEKPVKPVNPTYVYETPVVVEALTKKEKPVAHVKPVKHVKPIYPEEIIIPDYDEYHAPVVVEALTKKEKPVAHEKPAYPEVVIPEYDSYTSDEMEARANKAKPIKHVTPVHPEEISIEYDGDYVSVDIEALTKREKPVSHVKPGNHMKPVQPEVNGYDGYDIPITETVTKKEKRAIKVQPVAQIPAISEYGYDVSRESYSKEKKPIHRKTYGEDYGYIRPSYYESNENIENEIPNVDDIDERVIDPSSGESVEGSGSISERSDLPTARSFLPVDPNIWSLMSNIHAQERQKFKRCFTPKNETGNCMPIQMCSVQNVASGIEELLNNVCVIDEVFIGICCPEFPVETVRVDWEQFEEEQPGETFNEDDSQEERECGKLPTSVNKTIAWPWMAPLVAVSTGKIFCGGALISEQYVLSAAHCTTRIPRNRILVRLGPLDAEHESGEDFEVVEIKRHAQYNSRSMLNDIALLKLSKRVPLGDFRRSICIADDDDDYVGETAILLSSQGFSEETEELESLPVISNQECQDKMGVITSESILCTMPRKEETKCNDDSGAPLVLGKDKQFKVIGVLTWNRNDCDERFPSMFTRVSKYRKWIDNHAAL